MNKTSFLTGAIIGLAAGLLLAPQKGEDLREEIADNAKKLKGKLSKMAGNASNELADLQEMLEDKVEGLSEEVRHRLLTVLNEAV